MNIRFNILNLFRLVGLDVQFRMQRLGKRYVASAGLDNDLDFGNPQFINWFSNKRDAYKWAVSVLEEVDFYDGRGEAQADVYDLWRNKYVYRISATLHAEKIVNYLHFDVIED